jgi:hypothetical protein
LTNRSLNSNIVLPTWLRHTHSNSFNLTSSRVWGQESETPFFYIYSQEILSHGTFEINPSSSASPQCCCCSSSWAPYMHL